MKHLFNPFIIMFVALVLASLSCQAIAGGAGSPTQSTGSSQTSGKVLFQDDFSNPNSGWDHHSDEKGTTDYYHEAYKIQITNQSQYYLWANPNKDVGKDVIIDVDAALESGSIMNDIGVICRYKDADNFYFLTIGSDGYYGVSKYTGGKESLVGMTTMSQNTDVIKGGNTSNHIQVKCIGTQLILTVNGTELANVQDSDIASGTTGLIAGTYDEGNISVLFDNFVVTKP